LCQRAQGTTGGTTGRSTSQCGDEPAGSNNRSYAGNGHQAEAGQEAGSAASGRTDGSTSARTFSTVVLPIEVAIRERVLAVLAVPVVRIARDYADVSA
jgi:hypothetical protein